MGNPANSERFLGLLKPIRDSLYRFALRMAWHRDQAHDMLQETVLTAWKQFDRFEPGTNFRAWMFRILLNTIYRMNRKSGRAREISFENHMFNAGRAIEEEEAWLSVLEEPERVMQALDDRVVSALDELALTERQCFLLRLLEDFTYKEISEHLGVPMGTVMSHVYRARMKMRERLAGLAIEEGLVPCDGHRPAPE